MMRGSLFGWQKLSRFVGTAVVAVLLGSLPVLLVPVVAASAQCPTAGYERLIHPRSVELSERVPDGEHIAVLEVLNANESVNEGFAKVGSVLVPAPTAFCETTSGELGVFSGPGRLDIVVEPVGEISVWVRLIFVPVQPPTTTTEPPETTTTGPPETTTTIPDPTLPPAEVTTTTLAPTTTTTQAPVTSTAPPLTPGQTPDPEAACVPGGFTVGDEFIPFDEAPDELFARFPGCRSAFDEESG